jgi:cytochrome c oxidase assembly factor CtaG
LIQDALLFQAGLLAALMVIISPLGYWAGAYLWVRAIQDLTLSFIAPALIVSGRPWLVLRYLPGQLGLQRPGRTRGPDSSGPELTLSSWDRPELETAWSKLGPVLAVVIFNVAWLGWHVPAAFDLVHGNAAVRLTEHACYLATGVWFWLQVAGPRRLGPWQTPLRRLTLLTATAAAGTVLGMVLVFGANVMYPAYANPLHHVMTVLDDQQLSGAVLWMGMMPPLIIAGVALLTAWLDDEDSDAPADLGRLYRRGISSWSARSGMR